MAFLLITQYDEMHQLKDTIGKMKQAFNDLDEQAKLIVKTDLELNKAQEELDKRLKDMEALQKSSRLISTTLDENEIFQRLNQILATDIGFEKNLVMILSKDHKLYPTVQLGFDEDILQDITSMLENDIYLRTALEEGKVFSSINSPKQRRDMITRTTKTEHFVMAPILTQNGFIGVIFVGEHTHASVITEGDEELAAILAGQIGQAIANARLFEEIFRSSKELESKVLHRTRELEQVLKQVRDVSTKKSEFISAVSHELRTPLTSIKGYASILMAGKLGEVPDAVKSRLEKINNHSDSLVKMINDLLDVARIESGRVEMAFGRCDLKKIVENVHDLLTPQLGNKKINFVSEVSENIPEMTLDPSQIERAFINLINNAIKFTPEEGTITVRAKIEDEDHVHIEVADTGIGISKEDMAKLFSEFFRVTNEINQNVKGTGLGLVLTKHIIEAHKGHIWLESEVGKGTTFHFTLPLSIEKDN
jgi:signal transduction histidine kinase